MSLQMSEELVKQLNNYKAQLQQVEAALSTDPENEDLLKLQKDLQVWSRTIQCFFAGGHYWQSHFLTYAFNN